PRNPTELKGSKPFARSTSWWVKPVARPSRQRVPATSRCKGRCWWRDATLSRRWDACATTDAFLAPEIHAVIHKTATLLHLIRKVRIIVSGFSHNNFPGATCVSKKNDFFCGSIGPGLDRENRERPEQFGPLF